MYSLIIHYSECMKLAASVLCPHEGHKGKKFGACGAAVAYTRDVGGGFRRKWAQEYTNTELCTRALHQ